MEICKQNQTVCFVFRDIVSLLVKFGLKWVAFNIITSIQVKSLLGTKTIVTRPASLILVPN